MRFVYYQNPLRTRVYLDDHEKELFYLKHRVEYLEHMICDIHYYLEKDPLEKLECPNPAMNGKTNWELAQREYPQHFLEDEFEENLKRMADWELDELESGYHSGDCTCIPCTCTKCAAEYMIGIDTIKGLGKHEAAKINRLFCPHNYFDERNINEVLAALANYDPKWDPKGGFTKESWDSCLPRWHREAVNAFKWLLAYKEEHNF